MEFISALAEKGLLGLLLALFGTVIVFLYRENRILQEKRVIDAQETRDKVIRPMEAVQQTLNLILTLLEKKV